jgi:hypothetical protein
MDVQALRALRSYPGVRFWHKADTPSCTHVSAIRGKADMAFCVATSAYDPKQTNHVVQTARWCPRGEFSEQRPIVRTANYCPSPRTIRAQRQAIPNLSLTLIQGG